MDESLKQLADLCKQERLKRGLGQRTLSRLLKISPASISRFERYLRTPNPRSLEKLLSYFGIVRREAFYRLVDDYEIRTITCQRCLHRTQIKV